MVCGHRQLSSGRGQNQLKGPPTQYSTYTVTRTQFWVPLLPGPTTNPFFQSCQLLNTVNALQQGTPNVNTENTQKQMCLQVLFYYPFFIENVLNVSLRGFLNPHMQTCDRL